jgi:hypothetical protein
MCGGVGSSGLSGGFWCSGMRGGVGAVGRAADLVFVVSGGGGGSSGTSGGVRSSGMGGRFDGYSSGMSVDSVFEIIYNLCLFVFLLLFFNRFAI